MVGFGAIIGGWLKQTGNRDRVLVATKVRSRPKLVLIKSLLYRINLIPLPVDATAASARR